ncbi:hypothetical protein MJO28_012035 [Puccinia striiformis f. sp. tritici]|uniref:Uncharacterized protein n=1 Tax=Puccinia striiformis f. sp. tritici TaxID=168172 RepID=A0ACC0DYU1_9BASI|nr:hypothetical protein MJO28_012035 [Puccinia striiformis f. sp. tritici]
MITRLLLLILLVFDFVAGIEVQQPGRLRDPAQDIAITIHPEEVRRSPDTIESDKPFGPCTLETDDKDLAPSLSALKRESIQSSQRHHLAIQIPVHGEDSDGDKPPTSHSPSETKASSSLGDGEHGSVNRRKEECTICLVEFDSKLDQPSAWYCSHRFHHHCIEKWIWTERHKLGITCPTCRTILRYPNGDRVEAPEDPPPGMQASPERSVVDDLMEDEYSNRSCWNPVAKIWKFPIPYAHKRLARRSYGYQLITFGGCCGFRSLDDL